MKRSENEQSENESDDPVAQDICLVTEGGDVIQLDPKTGEWVKKEGWTVRPSFVMKDLR